MPISRYIVLAVLQCSCASCRLPTRWSSVPDPREWLEGPILPPGGRGAVRPRSPAATVVDEREQARRRQALDQAVQERLGLGIDPVEILEDDEERLDLALAEQQALDAVERPLAARRGIESRATWGSSTGMSRSQSIAGRAGSSARSRESSLPVTFSRIFRPSSRVSSWK